MDASGTAAPGTRPGPKPTRRSGGRRSRPIKRATGSSPARCDPSAGASCECGSTSLFAGMSQGSSGDWLRVWDGAREHGQDRAPDTARQRSEGVTEVGCAWATAVTTRTDTERRAPTAETAADSFLTTEKPRPKARRLVARVFSVPRCPGGLRAFGGAGNPTGSPHAPAERWLQQSLGVRESTQVRVQLLVRQPGQLATGSGTPAT